LVIGGTVKAVKALLDYLKDPSWKNFGDIIQGIGIAIAGLGVLFGGLPVIVIGAALAIVGTIVKHWDKIREVLAKGLEWLAFKSDWIHEHFGNIIGSIYDGFVSVGKILLNWFDTIFISAKKIFDGIIKFITGVFTGDWKKAWEGVKDIFSGIWDGIYTTFMTVYNIFSTLISTIGDIIWNAISWPFKKAKELIGNFSVGGGNGYGGGGSGGRNGIPALAMGTNYVPNDGLAYLHQGEAVIPKKYNQHLNSGITTEEKDYMSKMMQTMQSLDNTMRQGISVKGEFKQKGSDLVAVVQKGQNRNGYQPLSNPAYAR
jgi:phage-related protein